MPVIAPRTPTASARPAKAAPDYPTIALCSWLDFQSAKCDIDVITARLWVYAQRLSNAGQWFLTHDRDDPRYRAATALFNQLEHDECGDRAVVQSRAVGALYHLWNCVLACDRTEEPESLADDLVCIRRHCESQRGVRDRVVRVRAVVVAAWQELVPTCPIPAYMPDDSRANWVEWRLGCVPTWGVEELRETVAGKQATMRMKTPWEAV